MKCLFKGTLKEFKDFTAKDLSLNKWEIRKGEIKERYDIISEFKYTKFLREKAEENKINFDETEIISWLDSESIMLKTIVSLNIETRDKIDLIQELHIPFHNKRADYVLIKDNKILILEFSYHTHKKRKYEYQEKLTQVIGYKELLSNLLSKSIEIGTYTFIIKTDDENPYANNEAIDNLCKYINYFFTDRKISAIDELNKLPY